jgi:hypothetical protein
LRASLYFKFSVRLCVIFGLLFCIYQVIRQGIGAWYFRQGTPEAVQTAILWDSDDPEYFDALAAVTRFYADDGNPHDVVSACETAIRLSPYNAYYWADLGAAYEWSGSSNNALRAFERARQLFPNSPDINWDLANFYVRAGMTSEALRALRKVLPGDSEARRHALELATSATHDTRLILDEMFPIGNSSLLDFFDFLVAKGNLDAAEQAWVRVRKYNLLLDPRRAFPYFDALIQDHEPERASGLWSDLAQRFPGQIHASDGDQITNGGFESGILNGGFDWRIMPVEGAVISLDSQYPSGGGRSLRIEFDGMHNLNFYHVFQYILVKPNTRYRFSGFVRAKGISTDSGPRFQILDAYDTRLLFLSAPNVVGSAEWLAQQLEFKTGADTRLLIVRVARPASRKFDNRIAGTAWIGQIELKRQE